MADSSEVQAPPAELEEDSPCAAVRASCSYVLSLSQHVSINQQGIQSAAESISLETLQHMTSPKAFDLDLHYVDGGPLTAQYLLVVDALNFCFWPDPKLEYEHLSGGLKRALQNDPTALDASNLSAMTGPRLRELLSWPRPLPLEEERARLLREVGHGLTRQYGGQAARMVEAAGGSAVELVRLVTAAFPGFRDHTVYKGRQIMLYKRAQIFVGDVYGAYGGQGLGRFHDIARLTMFADYRVPVVLRVLGCLDYAPALEAQVQAREEIPPNSEQEIEIRAATVVAVEQLRRALEQRFLSETTAGVVSVPHSVQLDWWLWQTGEAAIHVHPPHHRTLTICY